MSDKANYVTCRCQNCDGHIEFDAGELSVGEPRTVECPHCHLETTVFILHHEHRKAPVLMKNSSKKIPVVIGIAAACAIGFYFIPRSPVPSKQDAGASVRSSVNDRTVQSPPNVKIGSSQESEWTQSRIFKQNDVQITLLLTHIETQRSVARNQPQYKDLVLTNAFALKVEIKNLSQSKIVRGIGWSGADDAVLTDNFGNQYVQNTYRNPNFTMAGEDLLNGFTLYPGQSTHDFMRFEKLVGSIQWLHLQLPAENFGGGSNLVRFEIPASQVAIQWPPSEPPIVYAP